MIELADAQQRVINEAPLLPTESIAATHALGRVLREPLLAPAPVPRFDSSAMDGYAAVAASIQAGVELPLLGEARTGRGPSALKPGTVMRIFTGAPLPTGADTVIMQEKTVRDADRVRFTQAAEPWQNVRRAGEDLRQGEAAIPAGQRMNPGALMLAASLDQTTCVVSRRPRVTILCTGDELREPGQAGPFGTIPESNSPGIAALAQMAGADVFMAPRVVDDLDSVSQALQVALRNSDLLLTIGGVSVGEHDYVKAALAAVGVDLAFWKVAIKPGKPLAFGRLQHCLVLALPGNPAAALVTFSLFGMPLLRRLQGDSRGRPLPLRVPLARQVRRNAERVTFVMGSLIDANGVTKFLPHANQSSGATLALAASDGLATIEAGNGACELDASVEFNPWSSM